jgi:hypothetical protein
VYWIECSATNLGNLSSILTINYCTDKQKRMNRLLEASYRLNISRFLEKILFFKISKRKICFLCVICTLLQRKWNFAPNGYTSFVIFPSFCAQRPKFCIWRIKYWKNTESILFSLYFQRFFLNLIFTKIRISLY